MVWNRYLVRARVHSGVVSGNQPGPQAWPHFLLICFLCFVPGSEQVCMLGFHDSWSLTTLWQFPLVFKPAKRIHLPALDPRVGLPNMWLEPFTPMEDFQDCDIPLLLCVPRLEDWVLARLLLLPAYMAPCGLPSQPWLQKSFCQSSLCFQGNLLHW